MRYVYMLIILLGFTCNAQKSPEYSYNQGQRFIRKAERKIEEKNYSKAETLLNKALNSNLGYCGIGTMMEEVRIYNLQAKIYREQKRYDKAITLLDSVRKINILGDCSQLEFIRIEMLIDRYGRDKVREAFSGAVMTIMEEDFICKCFIELPVLKYEFSFHVNFTNCEYEATDGKQVRKEPDMEKILKQQPFYALLE